MSEKKSATDVAVEAAREDRLAPEHIRDMALEAAASRDETRDAARQAELDRQQDVVDAVAAAGADELPAIGGPLLEPGLGR